MYDRALALQAGVPRRHRVPRRGLSRPEPGRRRQAGVSRGAGRGPQTGGHADGGDEELDRRRRSRTRPASTRRCVSGLESWIKERAEIARDTHGDGPEPRPALVVHPDDAVGRGWSRAVALRQRRRLRAVPLRSPSLPADTPFDWQLPRGLPQPAGSRRQPDDHRQGRARPPAVLRHAPVRATARSPARAAISRRMPSPIGRPRAVGSTGQTHPRSAMSLTNVAYNVVVRLGRSDVRTPRGADGGADVQRASDRAGDGRARSGDRRTGSPTPADDAVVRGARFPATHGRCRWRTSCGPSRRSSGRCSRRIRRSTAISIVTIARAISPQARARDEAVLLRAARLQRVPRRLQPVGPGDVQRARRCRCCASPTPASTISMAAARIQRRSRPDGHDAASPTTWAASAPRRCATSR